MRTFCVLTPEAREDAFCDGVFEDGVRVLHDGRLTSMLFSRVVSPAHDLVRVVVGPLIAALQEQRPAVLVVGLPGAEALPSPLPASSSSSAPSREATTRIAACCDVAMRLYKPLLSLLFQNLPDCLGATCSVVTASANDRWLYDGVQGNRVRTLEEVKWVTVDRAAAAADGLANLLTCVAQRHEGLVKEVGSLSSETACVVTLQLEPYAPLILVDVGSDQDVLQQLTLILGMWGACGRRTYPPRSSPLVSLLQEYVVPEAALHVVVVPEPSVAPRNTMRLLRFASGLESHRQESVVLAAASSVDVAPTTTTRTRSSESSRASVKAASVAKSPSRAPSQRARLTEKRRVLPADIRASQHRAAEVALSAHTSSLSLQALASGGPSVSRPRAAHAQTAAAPASAPTAPPPRSVAREEDVADDAVRPLSPPNDHLLTLRIQTLEAALEDVKNAYTREHANRVRLESQIDSLRVEVSEKAARLTTEVREREKLRADNAEFSEVVPRLLKKVSVLEKAKAGWESQRAALTHDKDVAHQRVAELQTLIKRLKKSLAQKEHQQTRAMRERTLHGLLDHVSKMAGRNARLDAPTARGGHASARAAPLPQQARGHVLSRRDEMSESNTRSDEDDDEERGQGLPEGSNRVLSRQQRERLHAITVDELRRRNMALEKELAALRRGDQSVLLAGSSQYDPREPLQTSTAPADVAESAPFLRERLEYFMSELSHARQEKDSLIRYILEHRDRLTPLAPEVPADPRDSSRGETYTGHTQPPRTSHRAHSPHEDIHGGVHSYQEPMHSRESSAADADSAVSATAPPAAKIASTAATTPTPPSQSQLESCCICAVLAALQAGCASLLSTHEGMLAKVHQDPEGTQANGLTAGVLQEHARATQALQQALSDTAQRPVCGIQHGPHTMTRPLPRVANMANGATLSEVLSFESERAARLSSFVPSFTQLAVATENLLMRVPRTPKFSAE